MEGRNQWTRNQLVSQVILAAMLTQLSCLKVASRHANAARFSSS